jgi:hypothetical protein
MNPEEAFLLLFQKFMPKAATISIGTVESVDKENHTCDVLRDGQPKLFNCRLNAVVDTLDSYAVCFPAVDSFVLCITIDEPTACYVFATTQIEEAQLKIGDISAVVNGNDIVMNGGVLGGLLKLKETTEKINNLEKSINELKMVFSGWMVSPNDGGAALKTAVGGWATDKMKITDSSELENKIIRQ